jgi:hypothetical protein
MTVPPTLGQKWSDERWGKIPSKPKSAQADEAFVAKERAEVQDLLSRLEKALKPVGGTVAMDVTGRKVTLRG